MQKTIITTVLVVGLAACSSGGDRRVAGEGAADSAASAAPASSTLAVGTTLAATIQEPVSSGTNTTGQHVKAIVSRNVTDAGGRVLIPGGADVVLTIGQLHPATQSGAVDGVIVLTMTSVTVRDTVRAAAGSVGPVTHSVKAGTAATRDIVVAPGTPITITLTQPLKIAAN